jgi:hypothetical protein
VSGECAEEVCGSHFSQSQSGADRPPQKAARTSSAGEWSAASWQSTALVTSSATPGSPAMPIAPWSVSESVNGTSLIAL